MSIGQSVPAIEVAAGTAFALLVGLARACATPAGELETEFRQALDDLGDRVGETWLNLLGVPLDAGPPYSAERLVSELEEIDPVELRRHLLGRYAWSWCTLAGADRIEAAAAGDSSAFEALLTHPRYYAGHAAESLTVLLPLDPQETRRRLSRAAAAGLEHLLDRGADAAEPLEEAARAATTVLASTTPLDAIERLTAGYRYVPEPEAERVLLVPHLQRRPRLVLAQHRETRLIVYSAPPEPGSEERLLALGRALSDAKRVEILGLLGRGLGRVPDLVTHTGLARSTVHHHLSQLRAAGLVVMEGNARAYTYAPRRDAGVEASALLADVVGAPEDATG
jgi:DNA-binding transcriptional ArsR family regulator